MSAFTGKITSILHRFVVLAVLMSFSYGNITMLRAELIVVHDYNAYIPGYTDRLRSPKIV